jgi:Tc5 transposase DNA-binding domain
MAGGKSRAQARELRQLLQTRKKKTLVRWVTRYTMAGSPLSPSLLIELAELIQRHRVRRVSGNEAAAKTTTSIGHEWLYRFLNRHPTMRGIYARQMENARFNGATYEVVKSWFDAVASLILEHSYDLRDIWNMDESGFGIGDSQNTRVIVPIKFNHKNKVVPGKQE